MEENTWQQWPRYSCFREQKHE